MKHRKSEDQLNYFVLTNLPKLSIFCKFKWTALMLIERWWHFLSKKERRDMLTNPSHCILVVSVCMLCLGLPKLIKIKPLGILKSYVMLGHLYNSPAKNIVANNMSSECESSYNVKLFLLKF